MEVISQPLPPGIEIPKTDVLIVAQFYSDALIVVKFMYLKLSRTT